MYPMGFFQFDEWMSVTHSEIFVWFQTPLHLATSKDHWEVIEFLILSGADINTKNVRIDEPLLNKKYYFIFF